MNHALPRMLCLLLLLSSPSIAGAGGLLVTNNLRIWLKADAITNIIAGQSVTNWPDSSGNDYRFSQASAAQMPIWQPNLRGGLPAVHFDGGDDTLSRESVRGSDITSTTQATVFCMFMREANDPTTSLLGCGPAAEPNRFYLHATWNGHIAFQHGSASFGTDWSQTPYWDDNWHVICVWRDGVRGSGLLDGIRLPDQDVMNDSPDLNLVYTFFVGRDPWGNHLKGAIGELLVYDRKLDDTERTAVLQYFYERWMRPAVSALSLSVPQHTLRVTQLTANRTNWIETSCDLSATNWLSVTSFVPSTVATNTDFALPETNRAMIRVRVEL